MKVTIPTLKRLLAGNVIELRFLRRRPKLGWNNTRHMLCTNNWQLLNSIPGKTALRFKPPHQQPKYNPDQYGLICAWDIMFCEYRMLSPETHEIVAVMPIKTPEEIDRFWLYFAEMLQKMSPSEKVGFMNN